MFVSLTARSNFQAIEENGVHLETRDFGKYTFKPWSIFKGVSPAIPLALRLEEANKNVLVGRRVPEKWDIVVVSTKALPDQAPGDAETIAPLISPGHTSIMLIQNGVGIEAPMRERFPTNPILTGVTVVSAAQTNPGVIKQHRWTRLHIGPYGLNPPQNDAEEERELATRGMQMARNLAIWWGSEPDVPIYNRKKFEQKEGIQAGGMWGKIKDVEVLDAMDIQCVRWHKLAINASFNPSAVLCGGKGNAEMIQNEELRCHVKGVMEEVLAIAPAVLGLPDGKLPERLGLAEPEKILTSTERNAGAKPSMLLDWEAGRNMELEAILGNAVRMARAKNLDMPRCATMYALLKSREEMRTKSPNR